MPTERKSPDGVLASDNYSTATLSFIQDDPDSPDANWWAWDGNGDTICRVSLPTPTGNPTVGAGLQEFRVRIRKSSSGGNATTWSLQLWENGVQVSVLATGTVTSTTGQVVAGTWNASSLGTANGSLVELALVQTGGGSGNPSNRRGIVVGAAEWNVTYTEAGVTGSGTLVASAASASGAGTSASSGTGALLAAAALVVGVGLSMSSGTGALTAADATVTGSGAQPTVTGSGVLVAQDAQAAGVGASSSSGTGALSAQAATAAGAGTSASSGSGTPSAQSATLSGAGVSSSSGTGALVASSPTISGTAGGGGGVESKPGQAWHSIHISRRHHRGRPGGLGRVGGRRRR